MVTPHNIVLTLKSIFPLQEINKNSNSNYISTKILHNICTHTQITTVSYLVHMRRQFVFKAKSCLVAKKITMANLNALTSMCYSEKNNLIFLNLT